MQTGAFPSPSIDLPTLTVAVHAALDSPHAVVGDWEVVPVGHRLINRVSGGIYHVAGSARDGTRDKHFSLILKVIHLPAADARSLFNGSDDPTHWNYWKREVLAYQSGILDPRNVDLQGSLSTPRC